MSPHPIEAGQGRKPWPGYFIVRNTGEVVPLIAIDELPHGIDLVGIPRALDLEDTVGMLNLGLKKGSGACYQVSVEQSKSGGVAQPKLPSPPATPRMPKANIPRQPPNSPTEVRETMLCRHWCTHGICKWGQQCRYTHIMPMTLNGLAEIGLSDWPAWYRSLNPGFFVSGAQRIGGRLTLRNRNLHARAEKRLAPSVNKVKAVAKKEEGSTLGEQIIERLRGMEREKEKEKAGVKGRGQVLAPKVEGKEKNNVTVMVERAAVREARRWEDESEGSLEGSEEEVMGESCEAETRVAKKENVQKGKLVDV